MRKFLRNAGFTLIEMAIVLVVIGLVFAGSLQVIQPVRESGRAADTNRRMDIVQQALQLYVIRFGCLPCPADGTHASTHADAGRSEISGGGTYTTAAVHCTSGTTNCLTANAVVPWRELGLAEMETADAWGDRLRYYVDNGTPCTAGAHGLQSDNGMVRCSVSSFPAGGVTIDDIDVTGSPDISNAAYVLVSSGPDRSLALKAIGGGTMSVDVYSQTGGGGAQDENSNDNNAFAYGSYIGTSGDTHFDDIVRFMTAPYMILRCGSNACGNPV